MLHYQPVVSLDPIDVVGFEALLRWRHPHFGTVPPLEFITIAEDTGLIVAIGEWVLETACAQLADWSTSLPGGSRCGWPSTCRPASSATKAWSRPPLASATRHGVDPGSICLELTESLLMDQTESSRDTLRAIARPRLPRFHRRLRHRLLVARLPPDVPGRRGQDRQVVRRRPRPPRHAAGVTRRRDRRDGRTRSASRRRRKASRRPARRNGSPQRRVNAVQGYLYARPTESAQVPGTVARVRQLRPALRPTVTEPV